MNNKRVEGKIADGLPGSVGMGDCLGYYVYVDCTDEWKRVVFGVCLGQTTNDAEARSNDFRAALCETFGVAHLSDLAGKRCFALSSFSDDYRSPDGIESVDTGKRLLINSWRRKWNPEEPTVLESHRRIVEAELSEAQRRAVNLALALANIDADYTDWETAPAGEVPK